MSGYSRVALQQSFVLHRRPYRETSFIIEIFSCDYGKLALIAKGARRKKSSLYGILQPFNPLQLSWSGKSELQTLTSAEQISSPISLSGNTLYCGFYLNELLDRFLHRYDSHPAIFSLYLSTLQKLTKQESVEHTLRLFELSLMQEIGYGLQLDREVKYDQEVEAEKLYVYHVEQGLVETDNTYDAIHGSTLIGLQKQKLQSELELKEAKQLMRKVIDYHLGGKPLQSRMFFRGNQIRKME